MDIIFRKFLELQSLNGVRKYLHERGLRSRSGRDYSLLGLQEILQNPVYCIADADSLAYFVQKNADVCFTERECGHNRGLLAYNKRDYTKGRSPRNPVEKWIIAIGRHEGRVSGKGWVAVQQILDRNKPDFNWSNTYNDYALLSGLIFCAKCGRRMSPSPETETTDAMTISARTNYSWGRRFATALIFWADRPTNWSAVI